MTKSFTKILVVALLTVMLATSSFALFKKSAKITITGSTTVLPISQACAEYYMANKNKSAKITVSGGGSSVGVAAVMDGRADIGDASREAKEKEITKAKENGVELYKNVVAYDSVVVVTNPGIDFIDNISREDLAKIYDGTYSNWKDLGGPDAEIVVISRDTSSGTYECFHGYGINKAKIRADAQMVASNQAMATTVAKTPNSIGYVGLGFLKSADIRPLNIDGIEANRKTTMSFEYPIARTLNMYTNGKPSGEVAKFIKFVQSAQGQKLVEEQGYVKIK